MKKLMGIAAMAIIAGGAGAVFAPADAHLIVKEVGDNYVVVGEDHTGVYNEDNGCEGYQEHAGDCDGDGEDNAADSSAI